MIIFALIILGALNGLILYDFEKNQKGSRKAAAAIGVLGSLAGAASGAVLFGGDGSKTFISFLSLATLEASIIVLLFGGKIFSKL